jgi:hypothetical protein
VLMLLLLLLQNMCPMNVFDIEDLGGELGNKKAGSKAGKKGSSSSNAGECSV